MNNKILMDTCIFLWMIHEPERISSKARTLFISEKSELFMSVASVWEILVKHQLGKISLPKNAKAYIRKLCEEKNIKIIELNYEDVLTLLNVPKHHKDPFDHMLICQAINKKLAIMTPDKHIHRYDVEVVW